MENALKIIAISPEIRSESNQIYSKAFDEAYNNGVPLRLELERKLQNRNLLDTELEENQIIQLRKQLKDKEIELRSARVKNKRISKEEGFKLAIEIRKLRRDINNVGNTYTSFFKNSAENIADEERFQYFIYACTVRQDNGKRYWYSYDDMKNETDIAVYNAAITNFLKLSTGIDKNLEDPYYENQWLKRMGFADAEGNLIDKKGRLIDENGKLINKNGEYIDEAGNRIDMFGNRIDDSGNLIISDGWEVIESTSVASTTAGKVPSEDQALSS